MVAWTLVRDFFRMATRDGILTVMCETEIKLVTTEEWAIQVRRAVRKLRKDGFITKYTPLNDVFGWFFVGLVIRWIWYHEMNILFIVFPAAAGLFAALAYELYFNFFLTKSGIVQKFTNQQVDIGLFERHVPFQFKSYVAAGQSLESDIKILVNNLWWFMLPPKRIHWVRWVLTRKTPFWLSCLVFIAKWLAFILLVQIAF